MTKPRKRRAARRKLAAHDQGINRHDRSYDSELKAARREHEHKRSREGRARG